MDEADITLVGVRAFAFVPGKRLEVITFEVKPNLDQALDGVFEALAHSAFAYFAFLAVNISGYPEEDKLPDDSLFDECKRLGILRIGPAVAGRISSLGSAGACWADQESGREKRPNCKTLTLFQLSLPIGR
jgi:hypothetical protein